ncbi:MAG TPA: hypothetical protein DEB39_07725, partial [Planctomycetaceae bacterium]|nr:hypothetical protein [Planctomycetaceae bacterium]
PQAAPPQQIAPPPVYVAPVMADPTNDALLASLQEEINKIKKEIKKPDTKNKWGTARVGGRLFFDSVNIADQNEESKAADGDINNDLGLRELFLSAAGEGFDCFSYKVELAFSARDEVNLSDCYVDTKNVPLFNTLRVGHFKVENGFAYVGAGTTTTLMEPTGPASSFHTGRRLGISSQQYFWDKRARWMFGFFESRAINNSRYNINDYQGWMFNTRLTMAPIMEREGERIFHIGASWLYAEPGHRDKTGARQAQSFSYLPGAFTHLDVGSPLQMSMDTCRYNKVGAEFIIQRGAFGFDGEMYAIAFNGDKGLPGGEQDRTAYGGYLEMRYFLTGDYRTYDTGTGTLGAVKMNRNFHTLKVGDYNLIDGFGAFEIVGQWNFVDLTDWRDLNGTSPYGTTINAGLQNDFTLGLNWFWNPNVRWILEYVHSTRDIAGHADTLDCDIVAASFRLHF